MNPEAKDWCAVHDEFMQSQDQSQVDFKKREAELMRSGVRRLIIICQDISGEEAKPMTINLFDQTLPLDFIAKLRGWFGIVRDVYFDIKSTNIARKKSVDLRIFTGDYSACTISFTEDEINHPSGPVIEMRSPHFEMRELVDDGIHETSQKVDWDKIALMNIVRAANILADRYLTQSAKTDSLEPAPVSA